MRLTAAGCPFVPLSAGDRLQDQQFRSGRQDGGPAGQVPDVFTVQVQVDVAADLACFIAQTAVQAGLLPAQGGKDGGDRGAACCVGSPVAAAGCAQRNGEPPLPAGGIGEGGRQQEPDGGPAALSVRC